MYERKLEKQLAQRLAESPAVALLGPRQTGKTTLALALAKTCDAIYLDLENPSDLAQLQDVRAFCERHAGKLIILDEVQNKPNIFAPIRGVIDEQRRVGNRYGLFLFLGSASIDLLKQSSETLAGRISYLELNGLSVQETGNENPEALWLRGGFPESYLAGSNAISLRWRSDFIRSYLERDIPQLGPRVPAETLRRFWAMLAHNQATTINQSALSRSLETSVPTIGRYVDLLVDLLLLRRIQPWHSNSGKRLIKSPKLMVRDSGVVHALLGIETYEQLLAHPVVGGSWEAFVVENIASVLPARSNLWHYRSAGGAEVDLLIELAPNELWAVEIKRSSVPHLSRGYFDACSDICPTRKLVVHSGEASFPLPNGVEAVSLMEFMVMF